MSRATVVVVTEKRDLPASPELRVVDVETYLAGEGEIGEPDLTVVNLCRSWRYLSRGYYVSLLADARGQTPLPTVETLEGLHHPHAVFRALRESGVEVIEAHELALRLRAAGGPSHTSPEVEAIPHVRDYRDDDAPFFRPARADELASVLVCLGRCDIPGFQRVAGRAYRAWPAPLLRLRLLREDDRWKVYDLVAEKVHQVSEGERALLQRALQSPRVPDVERLDRRKPSIALLYDQTDPYKASSPETLEKFERLSARRGIRMERIGPSDLGRLGEHDALFIRVVTGIDRPSFRFAVRAEALGLPVIDDPRSIIRCTNKIFLHELLSREGVPTPRTVVFDRNTTREALVATLGSPYIVKLPDGSFSGAVFKVENTEDHARRADELLRKSPLLVAQEYLPTPFDWRVTVLDGRPLFVCRYYMAPGHWQIRQLTQVGARYGRVEAVPRDKAPDEVVRVACRAAKLVGEGLYGVDLKDIPNRGPVVIEVNDNPNLDIGYDDAADGDRVYEDIISWFERRIPKDRERERERGEPRARARTSASQARALEALRAPLGRPPRRAPGHAYKAWEVLGLELEYPVVDRDLNALPVVEEALTALAGRPTSDVDLGLVAFSNEIFDHVLELKTPVPLHRLQRTEEVLVEGVRRMSMLLAARLDGRLLPGGMHPWLDPRRARLWRRSNRRIYEAYARHFDVHTHGWANVQASHVNLPFGREEEAVAMLNAASLLTPYLPALAASSPMYDGALQPSVDNRLAFILEHQARLPESAGQIVPEPTDSFASYRRDVLGRMYQALDRLPGSEALRHEFLNARGAVFKFSRDAMEVRVLDVQECVQMDVAIACFTRLALRALAGELLAARLVVPPHELLVADFHAVVRDGSAARVLAPHLAPKATRDDLGFTDVREVLTWLLALARRHPRREDEPYLDLVEGIIARGNLSERIREALLPHVNNDEAFTGAARVVFRELSECLVDNRPWKGRGL